MPRPRLTAPRRRWATAVAVVMLALAPACLVGPGGDFESLSGTGDSTGFPPDAEACDFPTACAGGNAALCCESPQPPLSLVPYACPAGDFQNAATCVSNVCVRSGCSGDTECSDLVPGYVCVDMGSEGRCAPSCFGDVAKCQDLHHLPASFDCETHFGRAICLQST